MSKNTIIVNEIKGEKEKVYSFQLTVKEEEYTGVICDNHIKLVFPSPSSSVMEEIVNMIRKTVHAV